MHHLLAAVVAKQRNRKKRKKKQAKKQQVKRVHHAVLAVVALHKYNSMLYEEPSFNEEGFFVSFRNEFASRSLKSYRASLR